jgi:hypothetical protein
MIGEDADVARMERSEIRDLPTPETKTRITPRSIRATRYMTLERVGQLSDDPLISLPAVAS